ncbi:hypothetical protein BGZ97_001395 [Linnemannia gamsii]|uniref:Uncharacterized protein n=1 Tax=Linnemannia gamsii TaxID=64522 RepID=A0A9P6QYZ9_9FUNG|nr:hypothetical protein BGZ97_001395 [Linnemannia gamsii]
MNGCSPRFPTDQNKLFALFLASLLHHQQEQTGKDAASILAEFGLQLVNPATVPLFRPFLPTTQEQRDRAVVPERSSITVDYSKYLTVLHGPFNNEWYYIKHYQFVRLIEMPDFLRVSMEEEQEVEDDDSTSEAPSDNFNNSNDGNNEVLLQLDSDYKDILFSNYNRLLLHYNVESITSVSFHISKAHQYLPMASKMASLREIVLTKAEVLPDQHLQDTIAFIRTNRTAFPRKPCLRMEFSHTWCCYDVSEFTSIAQSRTHVCKCMTSLVELYRTIGEPEELNAHTIPGFYAQMGDVATNRLLRLRDLDTFRIDVGEGPDMRAFLRRCPRLKTFDLSIGHPYILSWAAQEARDRADEHRQLTSPRTLLPRLDKLRLRTDRPYRFDIHALNDGMTAFSQTLKDVSVRNTHGFSQADQQKEAWFLDRDLDLSRQIRIAPLANTIGDWPFLLPQLRSLNIHIRCAASLIVGSFDMCPNLEELTLNYGVVGSGPRAVEPNDEDPDNEKDPRRQAPLDPRLFPKWSLPKLKELMLFGAPAMLFNYVSLEEMSALEKLTLAVDRTTDLQDRLQDIPRLSTYTSQFYTHMAPADTSATTEGDTSGVQNIFNDSFKSDSSSISGNGVWQGKWSLPILKDLDLRGPPATAFTFDLLKRFPNLVSLHLKLPHPGPYQRMPLVAFTPVTFVSPPMTVMEPGGGGGLDDDDNNDSDGGDSIVDAPEEAEINRESKLEQVSINGPWIITASDLVVLLTKYAPFLKDFSVQITRRDKMPATRFLDAFRDADEILRRRFGPEWDERPLNGSPGSCVEASAPVLSAKSRLPGRSLVNVYGSCYFPDKDLMQVDYMETIDSDDANVYREHGIRVFEILYRYYIHKRDKEWFDSIREDKD